LAESHSALTHVDAVGGRSFAVVGLEEAVGDFRSQVGDKDMYMHLVVPSFAANDAVEGDFQNVLGGFVVGKRVALRDDDASDRAAAWDDCATVAMDFLKRMVYDSLSGHALFSFSVGSLADLDFSLQTRSWSGDGSYHAVVCTFSWKFPVDGLCNGALPVGVWI
jgi:hypothetical protein